MHWHSGHIRFLSWTAYYCITLVFTFYCYFFFNWDTVIVLKAWVSRPENIVNLVINNFFTLQLPWILIWVKKKKKIIFPISLNLPSRHWKLFEVLNYIHCASRGLLFRQDPLLFPNNWSCKEEKGYLLHRLVKIN